jgi:hypothetical protein
VVATAWYRSTRGLQIAARIDAAAGETRTRALAVADKLRICGSPENVWHGEDLHNGDGELYEGLGTLWACNERLCPSCLASRSRRAKASARAAIQRPAMRSGYLWRFVTLTMPTLPGVSLPVALSVIARTWRLFSGKRSASYEWWRDLVDAGIKGIEFTLGDAKRLQREGREWTPELDGYHVHIHLLVLSRWIEWRRLREEWTACLIASLREHGIEQGINTIDGLAVCDVRLVVNKKQSSKSTISVEGAINEVAKYVTKSESWLKVPDAQLVEIASIERWPRMFELLGECREKRTPAQIAADKSKREGKKLRKEFLSEVENKRDAISTGERLAALEAGAEVLTEKRLMVVADEFVEYDHVVFDDLQFYEQARAEVRSFGSLGFGGELSPATLAKLKERTAYLDTQNLSALPNLRDGTGSRLKKRKKGEKSLREVGRELIERGERRKWRGLLAACAEKAGEWRRAQQARCYPCASFSDLSGRRWLGVNFNPAVAFDRDALLVHRLGLKFYLADTTAEMVGADNKTQAVVEKPRLGLDALCVLWAHEDRTWEEFISAGGDSQKAGREKSWQAWYAIEGERRRSRLAVI